MTKGNNYYGKKIKKTCKKKCEETTSSSSSDICSDSDNYIRTDLWNPKCYLKVCDEPKKKCEKNDKCVTIKECDPIKADICLKKNLLTVCRIPLASAVELFFSSGNLPDNTYFSQMILTYEIAIINKTNNKISNISIFDSLAGITFENNSAPYTSLVEVIKCPGNIILYENEEIAARKGLLNNPEGSYLPPNSVTKVILKLAIGAPPDSICEIRYVQNSVCIEGYHENSECKGKNITIIRRPIIPISETSNIWKSDSDFTFVVGVNINL